MEVSCCGELLACNTTTPCAALFTCLDGCSGDTVCENACLTTYATGLTAAQALAQCSDTSCSAECSTGVCGTGLAYGSDVLNQCVDNSCCPSFNACEQNAACYDCLTGSGTNCSSNALFGSYNACLDTNCPTDFCDSGIGYYNGQDPLFACNQCVDGSCCSYLASCIALGTTACIDCLTTPSTTTCGSQAVVNDIAAFNSCVSTSCSAACS